MSTTDAEFAGSSGVLRARIVLASAGPALRAHCRLVVTTGRFQSVDGPSCSVYRHPVHLSMIRGFRHRGLKRFYERGDPSRVGPGLADRVALALADLDDARKPADLDLPGYRLHPLKGNRKGFWSISVSGNWRIVFRFDDGDSYDVDLVDYH